MTKKQTTATDGKVASKTVKAQTPEAAKGSDASESLGPSDSQKLKKPAFLDRALQRTDVKKRDAKPAIEAALAEISAALLAGEELVLPPLGKIKVVKEKDVGEGAKVLTLKLRTMKTVIKAEV